jgi:hypothetical protein
MPAEMKARIAARQGKRGKQKQGPPYKAPITVKYKGASLSEETIERLARGFAHRIKAAASKKTAPYQQTRRGKRPIRAHNLLKKASQPGQDLRLPVMGGTKFPTADSTGFAKGLLDKSKSNTEAGPNPTMKSLAPTGPKIPDVVPSAPGSINSMPKVGADMSISNDPLVQYLARQAQEKRAAVMEDNENVMVDSPKEEEVTSRPPEPPKEVVDKGVGDWKAYLAAAFDKKTTKKKYDDKDHPKGGVDKVLRSA